MRESYGAADAYRHVLSHLPKEQKHLPAVITASWLREMGACKSCVDAVRRRWPKGAPITINTLAWAAERGLAWLWLSRLLPAAARENYEWAEEAAKKECGRAAPKKYERARMAALAKIWKRCAQERGKRAGTDRRSAVET